MQRTGGTGYIGGTVLDTLVDKHPEYDISVLLRNVPESFSKRYPKVHIVKGDYDSSEVISEAASKANVVVRKHILPATVCSKTKVPSATDESFF